MKTTGTVPVFRACLAVGLLAGLLSAAELRLNTVSDLPTPRVEYGVTRTAQGLDMVIRAETLGAPGDRMAVELGVAAARHVRLTAADAAVAAVNGAVEWRFVIPSQSVADGETDWKRLRLAFAIDWPGGPEGQPRLRQRYLHLDSRAPHAGLAADPAAWTPIDLELLAAQDAEARLAAVIRLRQPLDGKVTVVIDDAQGNRVRNLVGGIDAVAGELALAWDCLDDFGRLVPPGDYAWRSAHHPGIVPEYLMQFANGGVDGLWGFGSNHSLFLAACANDRYAFLGAPLTEGGFALIALDAGGAWSHGYVQPHGTGYQGVAMAATADVLYVVHDGRNDRGRVNKSDAGWATANHVTLTRFDIESERVIDDPARRPFTAIEEYGHGPGSDNPRTRAAVSLSGMAMIGDRLYVGSRAQQAVLVVVPASGQVERLIPLPEPGPLASDGTRLLAMTAGRLAWVDPAAGTTVALAGGTALSAAGLWIDPEGTIYLSDSLSHQIVVLDREGRERRRLGVPGGPYAGAYVPDRLVNPMGLVGFQGRLWVTENRRNPKRATGWDLAAGQVVDTKYGNPPYGAPAACPDPADPSWWAGLRAGWRLDLAKGTAQCLSVFNSQGGHLDGAVAFPNNYHLIHRDGRTFLLGASKINLVSELLPDGSVKDLAFISSAHQLLYAFNWQRVEPFCAAFEAKYPTAKFADKYGDPKYRYSGVLWVDRNGDGKLQQEEFEIGDGDQRLGGSGWGHWFDGLTWRLPVSRADGSTAIATFEPRGYLPGGAPDYPTIASALAAAVPMAGPALSQLKLNSVNTESMSLRDGTLLLNSDPYLTAYASDGRLLWQYPNRWSNVHGSHKAPLPSVGEMQGCLYFLGAAPLDERTDLFMLNGNHGRFFILTSDGLYLDEMFRDVRMGGPNDAFVVGGEPFGGYFGRAETDGTWYLQTGPSGYRVYRLNGLDRLTRQQGSISLDTARIAAAESRQRQLQAAARPPLIARLATLPAEPAIDGREDDWPPTPTVSWTRDGRFPVTARAAIAGDRLCLFYDVADRSPWRNQGKDWTLLFKTGDSVDLQLGADPAAPANRRGPVPGDFRLLIAPFEGKPLAVLYRHRVTGPGQPVTFTSPWRSETVDVVRQLPDARIAVAVSPAGYRLEASIALADLGLPSAGSLRGDFGVLYGDDDGRLTTLRSYWANPATALVSDVPGEIMLTPNLWGQLELPAPREAGHAN